MCPAGRDPHGADEGQATDARFAALLEDSAEELYEGAPCGYLSTLMDGTIARINATLLDWLGLDRDAVVGRMRFPDLLTVGGKLYHETHFAPLLQMQGRISGIALDLRDGDGGRLPVLVSSAVKHSDTGEPLLIRTTVFDARDRRAYERELLRRRRAAEEAQRRAEADRARLQEAMAALQQALLPPALPAIPGMETAAHYHTASPDRLGGDFYDVFPLDDRRFAFFLGDVCGKGPRAAAVTSLTRYTLRAAAVHDPDPAAALTTLNTVLHEHYGGDDPRFCTAIFGVLEPDPATGQVAVHLASGGHPAALVLRAGHHPGDGPNDGPNDGPDGEVGGSAEFLATPGGCLIGILPEARFVSAATVLAAGDALLLYTDGITEARTGHGAATIYGEQALREFVAGYASGPVDTLVHALTGLLDGFGEGLDDDTALLALGVQAPSQLPAA
ncbi:histidine kinase [Actinomadura logoneensis]|uniref:Histidine kinase n=1 Tax=Actinomadura logoneensis TaxID=2293572 RepID=A0A372JK52_9ACTN|nr:SpoIIE family protein phosphatase [Actinomadura logoneensis]RFU40299.1 histidine kinase [Actinomadura logoneensis]